MTIYDDDDMGDGIYGAGDDNDEDNGNGNNDDDDGYVVSLFILLVAVAKPCTRWHVSSNYYRNSTRSQTESIAYIKYKIWEASTFCNIFGLESSIVTGLDVCVLPLIARAGVFKGQARVVLQSRGDEDVRNALV